jgi:hypothetical protein
MKPISLFLSCLVILLESASVMAQYPLDFKKDGSFNNTTFPPFFKSSSVPASGVTVRMFDKDAKQPSSKYQNLIYTHSRGIIPRFSDATNNDINFSYKANSAQLTFDAANNRHTTNLTLDDNGEFSVKVTKPNIDNFLMKVHFESKPVRDTYVDFQRYLPTYDSLKAIYDHYGWYIEKYALQDTLINASANTTLELGLYLDSVAIVQGHLVKLVKNVQLENANWMKNWKWLNDGKDMLNPFYPNVTFLNRRLNKRLAAQQLLLKLTETTPTIIMDGVYKYSGAKQKTQLLMEDLDRLMTEKAKVTALEEKFQPWLLSIASTEIILNDFKFHLSDPDPVKPIVWMHHKNAANNYVSLNGDSLPNTIYENDQLMSYVHNLKPSQKVKASEKVDSIALQTTTEKALEDPFAAMATAKKSSASILSLMGGLRGTVMSLISTSGNKSGPGELKLEKITNKDSLVKVFLDNASYQDVSYYYSLEQKNIFGDQKTFLINQRNFLLELKSQVLNNYPSNTPLDITNTTLLTDLNRLGTNGLIQRLNTMLADVDRRLLIELDVVNQLKKYNDSKYTVKWLSLQTPPPFEEIEGAYKNPEKKPAFRSENVLTGESRSAKGNNRISYTLTEEGKSVIVAKDEYITYKTVRFWPTVGINYVFGSRTTSIFDETNQSFKPKTDIDNFEAVVGVKIYWRKKNITQSAATRKLIESIGKDNGRRGNDFLSGTFGHFGMGVSHNFLKNYYFGLGHDIIPGLSVQGGLNVFFRKKYDLQNGQIKREFDFPVGRPYFGIYMDPTLVTKLIQLF